jgi:hypothetical protein
MWQEKETLPYTLFLTFTSDKQEISVVKKFIGAQQNVL